MKRFLILLLSLFLLAPSIATDSFGKEPRRSTQHKPSYRSSHRSSSYRSKSRSYRPRSYSRSRSSKHSSGPTYKSGGTKYEVGKTYRTTGMPKVKRSESAKQKFLKSRGYKKVPSGYEVDHIVPLSKGGSDTPSNMQLIPKSSHKQKTAAERRRH